MGCECKHLRVEKGLAQGIFPAYAAEAKVAQQVSSLQVALQVAQQVAQQVALQVAQIQVAQIQVAQQGA